MNIQEQEERDHGHDGYNEFTRTIAFIAQHETNADYHDCICGGRGTWYTPFDSIETCRIHFIGQPNGEDDYREEEAIEEALGIKIPVTPCCHCGNLEGTKDCKAKCCFFEEGCREVAKGIVAGLRLYFEAKGIG